MKYLRIRNWNKYQDTAGRGTSYIKVQTSILTDMEFMCLPNEERLCFLLMLIYAGINSNKIPDDDNLLMHLCHLDVTPNVTLMKECGLVEEWSEEKHNNMLDKHEHKLKLQRERQQKKREKDRMSRTCNAPVTPMSRVETETETETDNNPPIVPPDPPKPKKKKTSVTHPTKPRANGKYQTMTVSNGAIPWLHVELFYQFIDNRKRMGSPMTLLAQKMFLGHLKTMHDSGHDTTEAMRVAIVNGWKSVYAPKEEKKPYGSNTARRIREAFTESDNQTASDAGPAVPKLVHSQET